MKSGVLVKKGYKQTEVGVIPEGWGVSFLESVAKRGSGHTPNKKNPEYWNGHIKWISLKDTEFLDKVYIHNTVAKISQKGLNNSSAVLHPSGTVVLSRDAGVGKSSIMMDEMAVSQHFLAWQCGHQLINLFFYYWLQSKKSEFERIAMGSTIKTIGLPYFTTLKLPLPKITEQTAIATTLSDVDALISGLDRLIAKKRDIKQAAMQELLTGKRRLPGFTGEWKHQTIGDISISYSGGTPLTTTPEFFGGDIPWVSISDMTKVGKYISKSERYLTQKGFESCAAKMYPPNSILFAMYASIGECGISTVQLCSSQAILGIITKDSVNCEFLYYFFSIKKKGLLDIGQQGTQKNLNSDLVRSIEIPLPSLSEQTAIATVLSDMDAEISALEIRKQKTLLIKQGMMQELLTGRIRLVGN